MLMLLIYIIFLAMLAPALKEVGGLFAKWIGIWIMLSFVIGGPIAIYSFISSYSGESLTYYSLWAGVLTFVAIFLYLVWVKYLRKPIMEEIYNSNRDSHEDCMTSLEIDLGAHLVKKMLDELGVLPEYRITNAIDSLYANGKLQDFYLNWDDSQRLYMIGKYIGEHLVCDLRYEHPDEIEPKKEYWQKRISTPRKDRQGQKA